MRKGACKHFTGIQHGSCEAGIRYDRIPRAESPGLKLPCLLACGKDYCPKWEEPTQEEIQKSDAAMKAAMDRMVKTLPWVAATKKKFKDGGNGVDDCPICGKAIRFAISSYNGHMRARCDTDDCVNFIE